jgi:hypothetical protein
VGVAFIGPVDESVLESPMKIWELPTIISPSMARGQFIIGAFTQSTILFSRDLGRDRLPERDDFIRNLIRMRGELRAGSAVPAPAGVLKGTLPAGSLTTQNAHAQRAAEKNARRSLIPQTTWAYHSRDGRRRARTLAFPEI